MSMRIQTSRSRIIAVTIAVSVVALVTTGSIGALIGYRIADTEWKKIRARDSIVRISKDLKLLRYIDANRGDSARDLLDTELETNLGYVVDFDYLLSEEEGYLRLRNRELVALKRHWEKHPPWFLRRPWETESLGEGWQILRKKHDDFLSSVEG